MNSILEVLNIHDTQNVNQRWCNNLNHDLHNLTKHYRVLASIDMVNCKLECPLCTNEMSQNDDSLVGGSTATPAMPDLGLLRGRVTG